jgi:phytol kinase
VSAVLEFLPAFGTPAGEVVRAALVALGFVALLGAAEAWKRIAHPPVEWTRKLVHVSGGVVSGTFPWLFATHWTVLLLGASSFSILAIAKRLGWISSVTGVERRSSGELLFPFAVYLLFAIAHGQPVFYLIALSALVFADSAAALLGSAYGRHTFMVGADRKSLEGSAAFLLVTFLAVHLMLLLAAGTEPRASVLIAAQMALLVTAFEAISMRGNDNLIVPLMTYYLLVKLTHNTWQGIAVQLLVQLGLLAAMLVLARRTRFLTLAGAIAAHLTLYAAFSLGGPTWIVAPMLALTGFLWFQGVAPPGPDESGPRHEVRQVFYVTIVPVLLLFLDNSFASFASGARFGWSHPFFVPFVASFAATLAIVGFRALRRRRLPRMSAAALAALLAWVAVTPAALWVGPRAGGLALAVSALMCVLAVTLYLVGRRLFHPQPATVWDLRLQALCVAIAAGAGLPLSIAVAAAQ